MPDFDRVEAAEQPGEMFSGREWLTAVGADNFVDSVGKLKTAVLDVHEGSFERQEFPVDVSDLRHSGGDYRFAGGECQRAEFRIDSPALIL